MSDSYTEVTRTSYGDRIGNSFKGIIFGIILFIAGTALLYWNEGRAVRTGDAINEAQLATVELPSIDTIDTAFNGKMVHATGKAITKDVLKDSVTGVNANAIALIRNVSYYQWVEKSRTKEEKNLDGSVTKVTTYTYEKKWVGSPVNSSSFKKSSNHENSVLLELKSKTWTAENVSFGAYALPEYLIKSVGGAEVFAPVVNSEALQKSLFPTYVVNDENKPLVHVRQDILYLGEEPNAPEIGDIRITYSAKPQADVSILSRVKGNSFEKFLASNGEDFYQLDMGIVNASVMYQGAKDANSMLTWILRGVGMLLIVIGLNRIIAPLVTIASIVPLLGDLFGAGAGLAATLCGVAWSCIIIAIAWIRFRPILGISLLVGAGILIVLLYLRGKNKKKAAVA